MNNYSPSEMIRLEILAYPNPEGLHAVEEAWRNLCRKLLEDIKDAEKRLEKHHPEHKFNYDAPCKECGTLKNQARARKFPEPFSETISTP